MVRPLAVRLHVLLVHGGPLQDPDPLVDDLPVPVPAQLLIEPARLPAVDEVAQGPVGHLHLGEAGLLPELAHRLQVLHEECELRALEAEGDRGRSGAPGDRPVNEAEHVLSFRRGVHVHDGQEARARVDVGPL